MDAQRPPVAAAACAAPACAADTIVIIGAGQAGGWAAHTLRQEGWAGRIVLLGDEPHPPHERPPLSKAVLAGTAAPDSTALFKPEAFAALNLDWRPGVRVQRIDRAARQVLLQGGSAIDYHRLILCTGGRARPLPVPVDAAVQVHLLRTIADALALAPRLQPGRQLVVIGGGWVGLEVAATARSRGMAVTVVEAQGRLCERTVPRDVSEHLLALHQAQGTQVLLGAVVERVEARTPAAEAGAATVQLADGRTLAADTVVAGIGLLPNDELAREAGLDCDGGVLVDDTCRTSDPHILAAGDVAVSFNPWAGRRLRLESWQNAQEQGMAAARSALGRLVSYQPLPWFWSDQYGMNLQIHGLPLPTHQAVLRGTPGSGSFLVGYFNGAVMEAALGPNAAKDLRFARRLIEQRKPIDPARLADPAIPMSRL